MAGRAYGVRLTLHQHAAGGLGGYMWKNRAVNQSSETLVSIAGIAAFSLAMGWSNETTVDNLGEANLLVSSKLAIRRQETCLSIASACVDSKPMQHQCFRHLLKFGAWRCAACVCHITFRHMTFRYMTFRCLCSCLIQRLVHLLHVGTLRLVS